MPFSPSWCRFSSTGWGRGCSRDIPALIPSMAGAGGAKKAPWGSFLPLKEIRHRFRFQPKVRVENSRYRLKWRYRILALFPAVAVGAVLIFFLPAWVR
jgi:hypothetical protein